jgi:uncharacterized protein DUF1353
VKGEFRTELDARRVHGTRKRHLLAPLVFLDSAGREHVVPEGFIYNGPSFPVIWGGDGEASSALHDHAYTRPDLYTRAQADALLREALEAEGMGAIRRNWWWLGVRAFGWLHFNQLGG